MAVHTAKRVVPQRIKAFVSLTETKAFLMETMKQGFVQNAGLADFWYCLAEKEMFGFVIRDKQTNIFSAHTRSIDSVNGIQPRINIYGSVCRDLRKLAREIRGNVTKPCRTDKG